MVRRGTRGAGGAWLWVVGLSALVVALVLIPLSYQALDRAGQVESTYPPTADQPALDNQDRPYRWNQFTVYGDSWAGGSDEGGRGAEGWPALLTDRMDLRLALDVAGGTGYARSREGGLNFAILPTQAPENSAVTVFFGSLNDRQSDAAAVEAGALQAYQAVQRQNPLTQIVVVGPPWIDGNPPAQLLAVRDAVRSAAAQVGATFVDPIGDDWFGSRPDLIGGDRFHPTTAGHTYIADLLQPVVAAAFDRFQIAREQVEEQIGRD